MTDEEGEVIWQAQFNIFGKVRQETNRLELNGYTQNLRYQGQYFDVETGLHYNLHRYYDPDIGRFTTQDPIGLAGGMNLYQYAPNALGWVDPLGLAGGLIGHDWHHFIPQEMFDNPAFMKHLESIAPKAFKTRTGSGLYPNASKYIHRQGGYIENKLHDRIHSPNHPNGDWNTQFKDWYGNNKNFTLKELKTQLKIMRRSYNIPNSTHNGARRYRRGSLSAKTHLRRRNRGNSCL